MENCTKFGQLIFSKIIKIVATSCQILRLKCIKFDFGSYLDLRRPTSKGRGGQGREAQGRGKGKGRREGKEREELERRGDVGRGGVAGVLLFYYILRLVC